ncbi:hypothetical protein B0J17DRAFT_350230 [Rhizoctonia solani]|nr:hypothetical protein B0J17DRAFT_350230 [Rhizoctonia solani]
MQLYGADRDKYNIENWLMTEKRFLGLEIESIDNTLRANIEMQMNALIDVNPGVAFIYMQGHGLSEHMGSYVTGDSFVAGKEPITIKSEEWMFMLSKFDRHTQFIVRRASLFERCNLTFASGNYRLLSLGQFLPAPVQVGT